jgi:hypothetical protein
MSEESWYVWALLLAQAALLPVTPGSTAACDLTVVMQFYEEWIQ